MQSAISFKGAFWIGFFSLAVISIPSTTLAITVEQVTNPKQVSGGWVTDMASMLTPSTKAQLNQMISNLEVENGSELAVVTVPETAPSASPKQFATSLFKTWHIGKKGKDNGVLLLISKGDRRVEIETGYGVEAVLPNTLVANIIRQDITPRFKQGDYNGGTLAGTKALIAVLKTSSSPSKISINQSSHDQIPWYSSIPLFLILGIVIIFGLFITVTVVMVFWLVGSSRRRISKSKYSRPIGGSSSSNSNANITNYSSSNSSSYVISNHTCDDIGSSDIDATNSDDSYADDSSSSWSSDSSSSDSTDTGSSWSSDSSSSSSADTGSSWSSDSSSSSSSDTGSSWSSDSSSSSSSDTGSSWSSDSSSSSSTDTGSSWSSDSSSSSSDTSSSWSSDSSYSSSSDFGGGSSGGSGAGDSW